MSRAVHITVLLAVLALIGAQAALWLSYFHAPAQIPEGALYVVQPTPGVNTVTLYESYRIFFIHLPAAYSTALCCGLCLVGGALYLLTRQDAWDALTVAAAEVGVAAGAITLLTGSFWADYAWGTGKIGSGWNWEPRLTTMLILWLAFCALLAARPALADLALRNKLTAVYGILVAPLYPLVQKAIEINQVSHPRSFSALLSAPEIAQTKTVASIAITLVFAAAVALRFAHQRLSQEVARERAA
jgi:heme exporter protein C